MFLAGIALATRSCMPTYDSFGAGYDDAATVLAPVIFGLFLTLVIVTHRAIERARAQDPSRSRWLFLLCLWPLAFPLASRLGPLATATVAAVLVAAGLGMLLIRLTSHRAPEPPPARAADEKRSAAANEGAGVAAGPSWPPCGRAQARVYVGGGVGGGSGIGRGRCLCGGAGGRSFVGGGVGASVPGLFGASAAVFGGGADALTSPPLDKATASAPASKAVRRFMGSPPSPASHGGRASSPGARALDAGALLGRRDSAVAAAEAAP